MITDIQRLLETQLNRTGWQLAKPPAGSAKVSFIARSGENQVFVKLGATARYLRRLAELGITPPVIADGVHHGVPFVFQECAPGTCPNTAWFGGHLSELAEMIRRYHEDETLAQLLKNDCLIVTAQDRLTQLGTDLAQLPESQAQRDALGIFEQLKNQVIFVAPSELVPVHADPNRKNCLVNDSKMQIVDWDDIILSDPLCDVGLICFWYLSANRWPEFFDKLGIDYTENVVNRLYWWPGNRSLEVYVWHRQRAHELEALRYLEDSQAAIIRKHNPHFPS